MTLSPTIEPDLETTLLRAVNTLLTLEIVLTRASTTTRQEITTTLAEHADNHGGWDFLIDTIRPWQKFRFHEAR